MQDQIGGFFFCTALRGRGTAALTAAEADLARGAERCAFWSSQGRTD